MILAAFQGRARSLATIAVGVGVAAFLSTHAMAGDPTPLKVGAVTRRQRAEQARITTDRVCGSRAKVAMMVLAVKYEMLAVQAEMRELGDKLARHQDD
jgi:hypothetical protein